MRQKDDKKINQIFDATLQLVEKQGLSGVTMCDISNTAGIATGTLYIYFKSKEELINELFLDCRKESADFYFKDHTTGDPFKAAFKKIFLNIMQYRLLHFKKSIFLEQCFHSPFITEKKRALSAKVLQPLFQLFDEGKTNKIIKEAGNWFLLWYIIGCINEVIKGSHYTNKRVDEQIIATLFEMCWDGIKKTK